MLERQQEIVQQLYNALKANPEAPVDWDALELDLTRKL